NLLTYANTWFALRLINEQFMNFYYHFANWTTVLPPIHGFLIGFCYFAQNLNSALLTLDRFIAVVLLDWQEKWRKFWWLFAAVLYILTLHLYIFSTGLFDRKNHNLFIYNSTSDSFSFAIRSTKIHRLLLAEVIFGLVFIFFCLWLNTITFLRLRELKKHAVVKNDRSFFLISLVIFIGQSTNVIIVLLYFVFAYISPNPAVVSILIKAMLYTSDVFSLGPGLYCLVIPGPINRRAKEMRGAGRETLSSVSTTSTDEKGCARAYTTADRMRENE
ncbi:hypothetical protein PENTCL1PPCAC_20385, partial [Pristionchus entomophagus]